MRGVCIAIYLGTVVANAETIGELAEALDLDPAKVTITAASDLWKVDDHRAFEGKTSLQINHGLVGRNDQTEHLILNAMGPGRLVFNWYSNLRNTKPVLTVGRGQVEEGLLGESHKKRREYQEWVWEEIRLVAGENEIRLGVVEGFHDRDLNLDAVKWLPAAEVSEGIEPPLVPIDVAGWTGVESHSQSFDGEAHLASFSGEKSDQSELSLDAVRGPACLRFAWRTNQFSRDASVEVNGNVAGSILREYLWDGDVICLGSGLHDIRWVSGNSELLGNYWLDGIRMAPEALEVRDAIDAKDAIIVGLSPATPNWERVEDPGYEDGDAAMVGLTSSDQSIATFGAVYKGPGTVRFRYKTDDEWGRLNLRSLGRSEILLSELDTWQVGDLIVPSGEHQLSWMFRRYRWSVEPTSSAWVDGLSFLPTISLNEALDTDLGLESGGDRLWRGFIFTEGKDLKDLVVIDGDLEPEMVSSLHAVVEGPGVLSFWQDVASELTLSVNDVALWKAQQSGDVSVALGDGVNRLTWTARNAATESLDGRDFKLDAVSFEPGASSIRQALDIESDLSVLVVLDSVGGWREDVQLMGAGEGGLVSRGQSAVSPKIQVHGPGLLSYRVFATEDSSVLLNGEVPDSFDGGWVHRRREVPEGLNSFWWTREGSITGNNSYAIINQLSFLKEQSEVGVREALDAAVSPDLVGNGSWKGITFTDRGTKIDLVRLQAKRTEPTSLDMMVNGPASLSFDWSMGRYVEAGFYWNTDSLAQPRIKNPTMVYAELPMGEHQLRWSARKTIDFPETSLFLDAVDFSNDRKMMGLLGPAAHSLVTSGEKTWHVDLRGGRREIPALRSGVGPHNGSVLKANFEGPGVVSFWSRSAMDSFASFRVGNGYGVMLEDSSWNLYRFAIGAGLTSVSWEVGPTSVSSASSEGLWLSDMAFQTAKTFGDEISYDGYLVSTDANAPWKSVVLEDAIAVFSPELASGHGGTYVQFLVDGPGEFAWRLSSNQGSQVVELDGQEFECNCEDGSILVGMGRHTMRFPIVPGSDPGTEVVLENIKYSPREPPKLDSETMPMEYHQWLDAEGYQGDRSPYFDSTGDGISLLMEYALGISPGHRDATAASRFPRIVESSSLRFQHRSETTLIYRLYVSSNLSEWFQVPFLSRATLDERWSEADVQLFEPARYARLHVTVPIPNG